MYEAVVEEVVPVLISDWFEQLPLQPSSVERGRESAGSLSCSAAYYYYHYYHQKVLEGEGAGGNGGGERVVVVGGGDGD